MNYIMDVLNLNVNKYCSETESFSYFIRKDELIFKGGYKDIWFKIENNSKSNLNNEFTLLNDVLELKRKLHLDSIYFEVRSGKLLVSQTIFGQHCFDEGQSTSSFTRCYISRKIEAINKLKDNSVIINEIVDFLILFDSYEVLDVINVLRLLAARSLYVFIVSKYIRKACHKHAMHEKINMGYFRYLVGLY